jgi:hypothetical protein
MEHKDFSAKDIEQMRALVQKDIDRFDKPVSEWTESMKREWREMGWKLPRI